MVNFSKNWNKKLDWGLIPTVRLYSVDKLLYYQGIKDYPTQIQLNNKKIHTGYLWIIKKMKLKNIPHYIKIADTGLTPPDFDDLMAKMYSKKSTWKGQDTVMLVLVFVRDFIDWGVN